MFVCATLVNNNSSSKYNSSIASLLQECGRKEQGKHQEEKLK